MKHIYQTILMNVLRDQFHRALYLHLWYLVSQSFRRFDHYKFNSGIAFIVESVLHSRPAGQTETPDNYQPPSSSISSLKENILEKN